MYLIFDCSATRKPMGYDAPYTDLFNWPRLLHLSWLLLDDDFKPLEDHNAIIKPEGFNVSDDILSQTHLTHEELSTGKNIEEVLKEFNNTVKKAKFGFSHNLKFNESITLAAFVRHNLKADLAGLETYCLMQESTYYCRIPNKRGGFKWPSLQELHTKLFNQKYTPTNNARADVVVAAKCFIVLKKMNMLDDIFD